MKDALPPFPAACACGCGGTDAAPRPLAPREPPADVSVSTLAELGALVGDPARANMLVSLLHAGELTQRELADGAGITPQTASGHLGRLLAAGLLKVQRRGRFHHYRLASADAGALLSALHVAGARLRPASRSPEHTDLGLLRTCRQHMAGRLAVSLARTLLGCDTVPGSALTAPALGMLARWGMVLPQREPAMPDGCVDWSEDAPHIGGRLGAAMLSHSIGLGWVRAGPASGHLALTPAGRVGFQQRFGLRIEASPRAARSHAPASSGCPAIARARVA